MRRLLLVAAFAMTLPCASAMAQVGPIGAPTPPLLGTTSPLGIGPAAPVAPTGIPLGATELANTGISPTASGVSPMGPSTSSVSICSGFGSAIPQASLGSINTMSGTQITTSMTSTFDGGGTLGNASGTCAPGISSDFARPAASASSPTGIAISGGVGRVGIPMGATELGAGGLSPGPVDLTQNQSSPVATSSSTAGMSTNCVSGSSIVAASGMQTSSSGC